MMGQWTRVQAAASGKVQKSGGLGFANETIYRQALNGHYARDFYDITQSEYGAGNGAYQPGPGWDYVSGWGSLNVANFIKDVDGTTTASEAEGAPEAAAHQVSESVSTSPLGNATDPVDVSLGNDPSLDLTQATLQASASKGIVATLSGPSLGALPPPDATNGSSFFVAWEYGEVVYYARADEFAGGELDLHLRQHRQLWRFEHVRVQRHGVQRRHRQREHRHRHHHHRGAGRRGGLAHRRLAADCPAGLRPAQRGHPGGVAGAHHRQLGCADPGFPGRRSVGLQGAGGGRRLLKSRLRRGGGGAQESGAASPSPAGGAGAVSSSLISIRSRWSTTSRSASGRS